MMTGRPAPRRSSSKRRPAPRPDSETADPGPRVEAIAVGKRYPAAPTLPAAAPGSVGAAVELASKPIAGARTRRSTLVLDDISFRAERGDRVVLLGEPGSGKSTLLRILAQIVPPTSGRVILRGRVAPTLDVASSLMQPERSGRANVGVLARLFAIPRATVETSTARVGSFAELGKRFDLPVKEYSTPERRRLAMALMLTLPPDILLLDDSLSAIDPEFQDTCIARIGELCAGGTTLIFTSRRPDVVERLATRALVLHDGRIVESGSAAALIPPALPSKKTLRGQLPAPIADEQEEAEHELERAPEQFGEPDELTLESVPGALLQLAPDAVQAPEAQEPPQPAQPPEPAEPADAAQPPQPKQPAKRRAFNEQAALLSGAVYTAAGEPAEAVDPGDGILIAIAIDIATARTARLVAVLEDSGRRLIRLIQPEAFTPSRPGPYTGYVYVPGGTLPPGHYTGRVVAWLDESIERSVIVRRHAFRLDVLGERETADEGTVERTDLAWTVTRGVDR